jgi:cell division protein FtsB
MKLLSHIPSFLRNKFFIATVCFGVWILFFDKNDFFVQQERRNELKALEQSKAYYQAEIKAERKFAQDLKTDPATIEKFAREKYGMKRDNEDLFLIQTDETVEK